MRRSSPVAFVTMFLLIALAPAATAQRRVEGLRLSSPLPGDVNVISLQGSEGLSRLFRFEVKVESAASSFEPLLGREVTVAMTQQDGTVRHFSGICNRVSQGSEGNVSILTLEIVPKLWLLTKSSGSRMFQNLSVPAIIERVATERGVDLELQLESTFSTRDCVVQYNETDFAFISRLMEEERIFYFFRHGEDGHALVLSDSPTAHPEIPGSSRVPFLRGGGRDFGVSAWNKSQTLTSGRVVLRDQSFALPENSLQTQALIQDSVVAGEITHRLRTETTAALEIYDYPGDYAQRFDDVDTSSGQILTEGQRVATVRAQQEAAGAVIVAGASNLGGFIAGHGFTLQGHPNGDGAYVLTGVQHSARTSGGNSSLEYSNTFTCIPAGLPFRPESVTPSPVIAGIHPAIVAGPPGERTHTDGNGRIKVKFPWDRESSGGNDSSCWIRVATPAGTELFIPEVGDQVVVSFVEGDPDRPIVIGSIPTP